MNKVHINNQTAIRGNNITVSNGRIIVDGKDLTPDSKEINIVVEGDVENLQADICSKITVKGNAGKVISSSGDIEVHGDVSGDVSTSSGDIDANIIHGDADTSSGDIKIRKR